MSLRQTLHALPRDARDTLFLLVVIAWVIAPQVNVLPAWASLLAAGLMLWRGWLAFTGRPLPTRWVLAVPLVIAVAGTLYTHRTILGRDAGVTLIVMLLALKMLELRARRDALVVFFLGFFTMLSNFFFSQSLFTAAAMLVALLGLLTALVNAHMPVGRPPLSQALRTAGTMALLGAPIIQQAMAGTVSLPSYVAFLTEAYHHVKHTVPLLMACGARLPERLEWLREAIAEYIEEEYGHQEWILNDIRACDAAAVARVLDADPVGSAMVDTMAVVRWAGPPLGGQMPWVTASARALERASSVG